MHARYFAGGTTLRELGRQYGVSTERARQIVYGERARIARGRNLSVATANYHLAVMVRLAMYARCLRDAVAP